MGERKEEWECLSRRNQSYRVVALEEIEQRAQRLAARRHKPGIADQDEARIVARRGEKIGMIDDICDPEDGQTRLARAQHLTRTSQAQILLGDAEAILGLAHDAQARFGGL